MSENDPHFQIGNVTYDGTTLTMVDTEYDDGEGGTTYMEWKPTDYLADRRIFSDTGVPISSGSTFTFNQNGYATVYGDASGSTHTRLKVVFVPKK